MFSIILYNLTDEPQVMGKSLSNGLTLNGVLRDGASVLDPQIEVQLSELPTYNYCYISAFNRYYFINDITSVRNNLWLLSMHVDVLESYKDKIKQLTAVVSRNENTFNKYITDDCLTFPTNYKLEINTDYTIFEQATKSSGNVVVKVTQSIHSDTLPAAGDVQQPNLSVSIPRAAYNSWDLECYSSYVFAYDAHNEGDFTFPDFYAFAKFISENSTYATFVQSVIMYPFKVGTTVTSPLSIGDKNIRIGDKQAYAKLLSPNSNNIYQVIIPKSTLLLKNSFLDFAPYTVIQLYLPFYGGYTLDTKSFVMSGADYLRITYVVDFDTGGTTIYIAFQKKPSSGVAGYVLYQEQLSCTVGEHIPMSASTVDQLQRQRSATYINALTGLFTGGNQALSSGAQAQIRYQHNISKGKITQVAAQGARMASMIGAGANVAGDVIGAIGQIAQFEATAVPTCSHKGNSNSVRNTFQIDFWNIKLYKYVLVPNENYTSAQYKRIYGRPLNKTGVVNDYTGYTRLAEFHLEGFGNATVSELDEIEDILKDGFIISV